MSVPAPVVAPRSPLRVGLFFVVALLPPALSACAVADHPETLAPLSTPSATTWEEALARPGVIEHEVVVSARWKVQLGGLLDLDDPAAKAAGKEDVETPIVLPVHVLKHPERGVFVVDSGVPRSMMNGQPGPARGLVEGYLDDIEAKEPLGDIVARHQRDGAPFAGVLLTHFHLDHVLGLPDVPHETPVYAGPGELDATGVMNALTRSTYDEILSGRPPITTWRFEGAPEMAPVGQAIDVIGDGSLWALASPGHTPGSTAYLALTTAGPKLFAGDTSHTFWGWENDVTPGEFTADHATNKKSLLALKALVAAYPSIEVFVGHELAEPAAAP